MNTRWYGAVVVNWLAIAAAIAVACRIDHLAAYWAATFIVGTRQHALAILGHDGAHFHVHKKRWLNDAASCLFCLWPLGMGIHGYRKFHFSHHRSVGTEADPELAHKRLFLAKWSPDANRVKLFITDLFGFGWREVLAIFRIVPRHGIGDVAGPFMTVAGAVAATVLLWDWRVSAIWLFALYTSFWAAFRLRGFTEHVGTDTTHRLREPAVWRKLVYLPVNTWLHWEHHKWPAIPAWQLKRWAEKHAREDGKEDSS